MHMRRQLLRLFEALRESGSPLRLSICTWVNIHEIIGVKEWRLIEPENLVGIIASVKVSYVCIECFETGTSWRSEERHTEYPYLDCIHSVFSSAIYNKSNGPTYLGRNQITPSSLEKAV